MKAKKYTIEYDGTDSYVRPATSSETGMTKKTAYKVLLAFFKDEREGHRATVMYYTAAARRVNDKLNRWDSRS